MWEKRSLKRFSKHYQTGEPLPDEMIDAMINAKNADAGLFNTRQLFFALLDQQIHSATWNNGDTGELWKSLWLELTGIEPSPGNGIANFGHLMGGYDAQV